MKLHIAVILILSGAIICSMEEDDLLEMLKKQGQEQMKKMRIEYIADSQRKELLTVLKDSQARRWYDYGLIGNDEKANRKYGVDGLFDLSLSLEKECNKYRSIELFIESLSDKKVSERYKQYQKEK